MSLYLVTGGAGFIGSSIVRALVARGDRVRVLDDLSSGSKENFANLECGAVGSGAELEFLQADVANASSCAEACQGVCGVFHEAAEVSVPASFENPDRHLDVNVMGTLRVLEAARQAGVKQVVFAASSAAYGDGPETPKHEGLPDNPLSPYAIAKKTSESLLSVWAQQYGMRTVALRYFNVFGPGQSDSSPYSGVIAIFAKRLLEGMPVTIHGDGEQTRDFVFVEDVARANLAAMDSKLEGGRVINIGTGRGVSLKQLYALMAKFAGSTQQVGFGPARAGDVRHSCAEISRAWKELNWQPQVSLEQGLTRTVAWYRER